VSGRHSQSARRARPARGPAPTGLGRPAPVPLARSGRTIFRHEALVSHSGGGQAPEAEIRLAQPWLRWLYGLALALVAAGTALVLTARTAPESEGTAVVVEPGDQFAALLPVGAAPELAHARGLTVVLGISRARQLSVSGARVQLADPGPVRRAGLAQPAQPSILLTGQLPPGAIRPPPGRSRRLVTSIALVLPSEPIEAIVAREWDVMLGTRTAGS
jgi:hypothetical protein